MDNLISDDELAALGLSLDDEVVSSSPTPAPSASSSTPAQPEPAGQPVEKVMSQAEIDALIASMNL